MLESWIATGRLVLRGVLDSVQVRSIDEAVLEVENWAGTNGPGLHHFEHTDAGRQIARSEDFEPHAPLLSSVFRRGPITEVLADLFGEPAVLFKEKINYKHPGGGGFAPHQDATAYRFVDHHISVMVPLDAATQASGCLWFCDRQNDIVPNESGRISPEWVATQEWRSIEVEPGDLVFFDSYSPHYSETNRSTESRRALYLTYNRLSDGDFRDEYYADKHKVLTAAAANGERVRVSVNDDFLGRPA